MPQEHTQTIAGTYSSGKTLLTSERLNIYAASHNKTHEAVELYVLTLPSHEQSPAITDYFHKLEQRQKVQSTHVLQVYDWGQDGDQVYIVTESMHGISLQDLVDTENISIERAIEIVQQIGLGLTALHAQNITGLDLRPRFITVDTIGTRERIQITDIGLRELLQTFDIHTDKRSSNDIAFVDPRYAPPEFLDHTEIGAYSDIYQSSILLFALVTGRLPFIGRTPDETAAWQKSKPLPPMRQFKHDTPDTLQEILQHATQKSPQQRFTNAAAFIRALATVQQERPIQASGPIMSLKDAQLEEGHGERYTTEMHILKGDVSRAATQIGSLTRSVPESTIVRQLPINGVYAYIRMAVNIDGQEAQRIPLTRTSVTLGRKDPKRNVVPDIDLTPLDPKMTISRQHARIHFTDGVFTLEDLKSSNHTRINENVLIPFQPAILQHGDTFVLGSVHLRFEIPGIANS